MFLCFLYRHPCKAAATTRLIAAFFTPFGLHFTFNKHGLNIETKWKQAQKNPMQQPVTRQDKTHPKLNKDMRKTQLYQKEGVLLLFVWEPPCRGEASEGGWLGATAVSCLRFQPLGVSQCARTVSIFWIEMARFGPEFGKEIKMLVDCPNVR